MTEKRKNMVIEEPMEFLLELLGQEDCYPSDQYIIQVDNLLCVVYSDILYSALLSLPQNQREVILLEFWHDWSSDMIAKKLEVSTRTIYNLKQRAFKAVRKYYENT